MTSITAKMIKLGVARGREWAAQHPDASAVDVLDYLAAQAAELDEITTIPTQDAEHFPAGRWVLMLNSWTGTASGTPQRLVRWVDAGTYEITTSDKWPPLPHRVGAAEGASLWRHFATEDEAWAAWREFAALNA